MAVVKELSFRTCPLCGENYAHHPAISRVDNKTEICPCCGIRQALESIGVNDVKDQDHIIDLVRVYERKVRVQR